MDAKSSEELLLSLLEEHCRYLGMGIGRQGEKVGAATPLAQRAEEAEEVGLGHSGHAQFGPREKIVEDYSVLGS